MDQIKIRTKVCPSCGEEFSYTVTRGSDRKYCAKECRVAAVKVKMAALAESFPLCDADGCEVRVRSTNSPWCEKHYGRIRRTGTLDRIYREPNRICHHCGGPAPKQRIFCSAVCATRDRIGAEFSGRNCVHCDGEIEHKTKWGSIYCSKACQQAAGTYKRYGLSVKDYKDLLSSQAGACAVCGTNEERLVIDHCHTLNKVRGLLCGTCNAGIGMLKDSPVVLTSAANYLEKFNALGDEQPQEASAA